MSSENFLKNAISEKSIKNKQLSALQAKETEFFKRESEISDLLKQAQSKYDNCIRANLAGNVTDQELMESKLNLKGLSDSLLEIKENFRILVEVKAKLMSEISVINGDLSVHKAILCGELAQEKYTELSKDKKLYQKLIDGYAAFCGSTELIKSWEVYLSKCFEYPPEEAMRVAEQKLKDSNEILSN